jgi:hypothetical protein
LRTLRARLDAAGLRGSSAGADPDAFELDLYAYDHALIVAADLLDVAVPPGARGEMSAEQRVELEAGLASAGLDVRGAG